MILYLGNMLSGHGKSKSVIETLSVKLAKFYPVVAASRRKNKILRMIDMLFILFRNRRRARVVLIDTYSTQAFWYAVMLASCCRLLSVPYVPILHGGNMPVRWSKSKLLVRCFFNHAFSVVAPSLYLTDYFTRQGFKVVFIPNFVELENYSFLKRSGIRPRILWVRSFHEIYNPSLAVRTLALLVNEFPDARLCMVGGFKDQTIGEVRELIDRYDIGEKCEITGALPNLVWINLAKNFDIFLNTTNVDNMPVSVIEAMALGLVVVSTNVGGLPYLIEDQNDGVLVNADDPERMSAAISTLIRSPERIEGIQLQARQKAEMYSWEAVMKNWKSLLDQFNK